MSHVLLIGFMGSGKSTVGRLLAHKFGRPFIDTDRRIADLEGMRADEIFATRGEDEFRRVETAVLKSLGDEPSSVVACGGGVVVRDENRAVLRGLGTVVYLRVSAGEALARIGDTASRPLLAGPGATLVATSLLSAREAVYAAVADFAVDTEGLSVEAVVTEVSSALEKWEASC